MYKRNGVGSVGARRVLRMGIYIYMCVWCVFLGIGCHSSSCRIKQVRTLDDELDGLNFIRWLDFMNALYVDCQSHKCI